jgi:hypothetical protein
MRWDGVRDSILDAIIKLKLHDYSPRFSAESSAASFHVRPMISITKALSSFCVAQFPACFAQFWEAKTTPAGSRDEMTLESQNNLEQSASSLFVLKE